jgi:hypothetical protein
MCYNANISIPVFKIFRCSETLAADKVIRVDGQCSCSEQISRPTLDDLDMGSIYWHLFLFNCAS